MIVLVGSSLNVIGIKEALKVFLKM